MIQAEFLMFIAVLVGITLASFIYTLRSRDKHFFWRRSNTYLTGVSIGVLLVLLSACGGNIITTIPRSTPNITPLALTSTPNTITIPAGSGDWTTYHHDNQRTGYIADTPDPQHLTNRWSSHLDGAVYAEPLVVGQHVIAVTENDSLYSLDPQTGKVQWHTNVGSPVPLSSLPCGNIDPLGITGTPVYDPSTGLVFAVAEITGPAHILVGVDINSGQVKVLRSVDTGGMDPPAYQQRAALTVSNGMVYIPLGGLDGDCSDYIGHVLALRTDGWGPLLAYAVPTPREGGIWATPGASVDASGNLFVSVGNGAITEGQWDHSDSVLRLSPTLQLEDAFAPTSWGSENANDEDMGSQGPVLLPGNLVFAAGKSGKGYTLHANALGGVGGQIEVQDVSVSFGGPSVVGSTVFIPCTTCVHQD